ncbi:lactonase family protein [Haladaptatus sp. T7]|uniref:lactonase family protein n=1 Tax=Haladaptatus sp. T7 TaxID=2029368 RepID=UPI0021A254F8|nr:lactonase family protein [Haladaptatus sp. T7]GKZ15228.1 6-phosphogluconolactonase [Haladaptatus sp. T7]
MVDSRSVMLVCSSPGDGSDGVISYRFDAADGSVTKSGRSPAENPYYLAVHPTGQYVFTVDRIAGGLVSAYRIDGDATLTRLNRRSSGGGAPCYVSTDSHGNYVYVANYGGGTVSAFPVGSECQMGGGTTVEFEASGRETASHPHSIAPGATDGIVYVPDLGRDRIVTLFHRPDGALESASVPDATLPAGTGPRHFDRHPNGRFLYVVNEIDSTLTAFEVWPGTGALREAKTVSTVPSSFDGENRAADLRVHPSGRWVYGSNRGHDSIAFFEVDSESGHLDMQCHVPSGGRTPRTIALDPTGRYLFAANKDSGAVAVFELHPETGRPQPRDSVEVPKPMCVRFVPIRG